MNLWKQKKHLWRSGRLERSVYESVSPMDVTSSVRVTEPVSQIDMLIFKLLLIVELFPN